MAVAANFSATARTGTINIAGQTFTVTQAGRTCTASSITAGQTPQRDTRRERQG
jgi:hypothetical protein